MARRIRSIKPEFWDHEQLGRLSPLARLTYTGMWNLADDRGLGRGDPEYLWGELHKYQGSGTKANWKRALSELEAVTDNRGNLVIFYEVAGARYYWIPGLCRQQRIKKPYISRLPPPPENGKNPALPMEQGAGSREQGGGGENGNGHENYGGDGPPAAGVDRAERLKRALDALDRYRVPGRTKKEEYVEDLDRQGVSFERVVALAEANPRVDFMELYRALKSSKPAVLPLGVKPSGRACEKCKAQGLIESDEEPRPGYSRALVGCPMCKGSGVEPA